VSNDGNRGFYPDVEFCAKSSWFHVLFPWNPICIFYNTKLLCNFVIAVLSDN
jgi:hypothetical protein